MISCTCGFFHNFLVFDMQSVVCFILSVEDVTFSISCNILLVAVFHSVSCRCELFDKLCLIFDQLSVLFNQLYV